MWITSSTGDASTVADRCVTCQDGDVDFEFIADRPVLDFVATLAERGTSDVEHLRVPADLADWLEQSGLVGSRSTVTASDLERGRDARDAMFRLLAARIDGTRPAARDRALVNELATQPGRQVCLGRDAAVRWRGDVPAVLADLARDCLALYADRDGESLTWCADPRCTRPFVDRSRGHRRRWCGMRGCGDRAKAAAYRARRRRSST
jgi:predicted RNA-binding Zn ribbon-like protein